MATLDDAVKALRAEMYENTEREDLSPVEIVSVGQMIEGLEKEKARARQANHGAAPGRKKNTSGKFPGASVGDARDRVGACLGVSGKTYEKAKQTVAAIGRDPVGNADPHHVADSTTLSSVGFPSVIPDVG